MPYVSRMGPTEHQELCSRRKDDEIWFEKRVTEQLYIYNQITETNDIRNMEAFEDIHEIVKDFVNNKKDGKGD